MHVLLIVLQEGYSVKHIIGNVYRVILGHNDWRVSHVD